MITDSELIKRARKPGTITAIAEELGVSKQTVSARLIRLGFPQRKIRQRRGAVWARRFPDTVSVLIGQIAATRRDFGEAIRAAMEQQSLTPPEVAERTGLKVRTIEATLGGRRTHSLETIARITLALSCRLELTLIPLTVEEIVLLNDSAS